MKIDFINTKEYKQILKENMLNILGLLLDKNQEFNIVCEVKNISFNPTLPQDILDTFNDVVMFVISGYTFNTVTINSNHISFETGFGVDNFGSTLTIPILALKQIMVEDYPILINSSEYITKDNKPIKSSMEALMSNPKNRKLLKKNR